MYLSETERSRLYSQIVNRAGRKSRKLLVSYSRTLTEGLLTEEAALQSFEKSLNKIVLQESKHIKQIGMDPDSRVKRTCVQFLTEEKQYKLDEAELIYEGFLDKIKQLAQGGFEGIKGMGKAIVDFAKESPKVAKSALGGKFTPLDQELFDQYVTAISKNDGHVEKLLDRIEQAAVDYETGLGIKNPTKNLWPVNKNNFAFTDGLLTLVAEYSAMQKAVEKDPTTILKYNPIVNDIRDTIKYLMTLIRKHQGGRYVYGGVDHKMLGAKEEGDAEEEELKVPGRPLQQWVGLDEAEVTGGAGSADDSAKARFQGARGLPPATEIQKSMQSAGPAVALGVLTGLAALIGQGPAQALVGPNGDAIDSGLVKTATENAVNKKKLIQTYQNNKAEGVKKLTQLVIPDAALELTADTLRALYRDRGFYGIFENIADGMNIPFQPGRDLSGTLEALNGKAPKTLETFFGPNGLLIGPEAAGGIPPEMGNQLLQNVRSGTPWYHNVWNNNGTSWDPIAAPDSLFRNRRLINGDFFLPASATGKSFITSVAQIPGKALAKVAPALGPIMIASNVVQAASGAAAAAAAASGKAGAIAGPALAPLAVSIGLPIAGALTGGLMLLKKATDRGRGAMLDNLLKIIKPFEVTEDDIKDIVEPPTPVPDEIRTASPAGGLRIGLIKLDNDQLKFYRTDRTNLKSIEKEKEFAEKAQDQGVTGNNSSPTSGDLDKHYTKRNARKGRPEDLNYDQIIKLLKQKGSKKIAPYFTVDASVYNDIAKMLTGREGDASYKTKDPKIKRAVDSSLGDILKLFVTSKKKVPASTAKATIISAFKKEKIKLNVRDRLDGVLNVYQDYGLIAGAPAYEPDKDEKLGSTGRPDGGIGVVGGGEDRVVGEHLIRKVKSNHLNESTVYRFRQLAGISKS